MKTASMAVAASFWICAEKIKTERKEILSFHNPLQENLEQQSLVSIYVSLLSQKELNIKVLSNDLFIALQIFRTNAPEVQFL